MKKILLPLLLVCFLKTASAQLTDLAWFQNQYHNSVQDFAFHGTHVWIAKPDYVMMLDTVSGQTQVFNDFVFPAYDYFGSFTIFFSILVDDSEHVFVNYYGIENGIMKYDGQTWTNFPCSGFSDQSTSGTKLFKSSQHHFFMAHGNVVGEFDETNWQTYSFGQDLYHGAMDSQDTLWLLASTEKLISFYNGNFTLKLSAPSYGITIDDYDNLFLPYTSNKIRKFHAGIIDTITTPNFYNFSYYLMAADSDSHLYFGGYNNHYFKFDGSNWYDLTVALPGSDYDYQTSIGVDDQHHVWFGSNNGFLAKQENDSTSTIYIVNYSGLPDDGVYAMSAFFFNNSIYGGGLLGTSEGLFNIDWFSHSIAKVDSGFDSVLTDKRINCVEKFGNYGSFSIDTIWTGTNEGLFGEDQNYNWVQFTTANSPLPNDTINYILYDNDKLWIATNGGVACYHFNGSWETFTMANSPLPSNQVHSISQGFSNYIFCTANGVAFYDDPDWKTLNTTNSGLIDNDVKTFWADNNGSYYFGTTAHGICDSTYNGTWTYFNTSTGLPSDSILFISAEYGFGDPMIAGTHGGGILSFENGNYLYNTTNIEGIDFSDVTDQAVLFLGESEEIWITTDKGLLYKDFGSSAPNIPSQTNGVSAYFSNENLMISYELKESGVAEFDLVDLNGSKLIRVKCFGMKGKNSIAIPVSRLTSGVYILRMQSGNQIASVKAVKMN